MNEAIQEYIFVFAIMILMYVLVRYQYLTPRMIGFDTIIRNTPDEKAAYIISNVYLRIGVLCLLGILIETLFQPPSYSRNILIGIAILDQLIVILKLYFEHTYNVG
ncbi:MULTISPECIES: hypothetical protein [Halomicrobium]|uniref:DUF3784 domain-containing protein n=1 Tax=Halomicrobium mukohataei TaxID=57705 RepID=A0A4D6KJQ4_9EURY|nr:MULTISPECIES: hypothetical protein [Halomicrobium]QCD65456.1 hypothetical protein E5139_07315 [Halomicrobium mukohataei]QFR20262.1 hypothetical protein GBQ70_07310 [Halomicrobium sp. ZPS1]